MIVEIFADWFDGGELLLLLGGIGAPPLPVGCVEISFAGVIGILITPVEFMKEI